MRNVEFYIIPYRKRADGAWVTCKEDGSPLAHGGSIGEQVMAPDNIAQRVLGKIWLITDSAIMYQLAGDLQSTRGSSQSILLANVDGEFGTIESALPYSIFVEDKDNFMLGLSIRPPQERLAHYPSELDAPDNRVYAWGGFLTNSEFVFGGDYIQLDFKDYTYWSGNFRVNQNYAHIGRTALLNDMANAVPFVVGDPLVPGDIGLDEEITELPDVWDMRKAHRFYFGMSIVDSDPFDMARYDDDYFWARIDNIVYKVALISGTVHAIFVNDNYMPPEGWQRSSFIQDVNAQLPTAFNTPISPPMPYYKDGDGRVPPQAGYTNSVANTGYCFYLKPVGDNVEVHGIRWDAATLSWILPALSHTLDSKGQSEWEITIGSNTAGNLVALITPVEGELGYIETIVSRSYPQTKTGQVRHYVQGHTIGGIEYPFLGKRKDGAWVWSYVVGRDTVHSIEANIKGINAERLDKIPKGELYHLDTAKYPNCICYAKTKEDRNYLAIVNDKFELLEELYPGEPPPREGHTCGEVGIGEGIGSTTLVGPDYIPAMLGVFPQEDSLNIMTLQKITPASVLRLFAEDWAVGKAVSTAAKCFSAWAWFMPNMRLWFKNFGADSGTAAIDLKPEVRLKAGNEDSINYWGQQFEQIKCEFGADRQVSIGKSLWNHKTKSLDLKEVIYSADHARMLALQDYLIYHPFRQRIRAPLFRGSMFLLWTAFTLHKEWATILTRIDLGSLISEIQGIKPPLMLDIVFDEMDLWIAGFWLHVISGSFPDPYSGWYFCDCYDYGCIPAPPGGPAPWCCSFIGDTLGYPELANSMLRALMEQIQIDINDDAWTGDFSTWWDIHYFEYWDQIYAIMMVLEEAGYF